MPGVLTADTDDAFDLLIDLDRRWRAGQDQQVWPEAELHRAALHHSFQKLLGDDRFVDAQRFAACAFGPMTMHFDAHTASKWAHVTLESSLDAVGPWTASACAIAAWGDMAQGRLDAATTFIRRGVAALDRGAIDDGLLVAAMLHLIGFGGDLVVSADRLDGLVRDARATDDLHRQVWVCSYTGHPEEALAAASTLGSRVLTALALSSAAAEAPDDLATAEQWSSDARSSHSFLLRNNAGRHLGALRVRNDQTLVGMRLLELTAADWLHRADTRVWDAVWSMAVGFQNLGDDATASALRSAIGDRAVGTISFDERLALNDIHASGAALGAAAAVALASDRLAEHEEHELHGAGGPSSLTPRQQQVGALIARGLTNKEIAATLGVSRLTAETHVRNILVRMGVPSRAAVAALMSKRDLG